MNNKLIVKRGEKYMLLSIGFVGEVIFEAVKFVIMILLLALAVVAGGKLRKAKDAKKAATQTNVTTTQGNNN